MTTTTATEYPGLEAKAKLLFEIPYGELSHKLKASVRNSVMRDAADSMHKALCHAFYRNHEYSENCAGCTAGRDAIAKAEGRTM